METPSVRNTSLTDDVIADDGRRTNTARPGVDSSYCSSMSQSRATSGIRRIYVAPAASDNVIQSPEPPETIQCSWRPVKPGYATNVGSTVLIEKTVEVEDFDRYDDNEDDTDSSFQLAIPVMSRPVAVLCAVCNVLSPGLGE